ncbi:FAD dependent oxidoreductase [Amylostereum chailletii]|nr:FAD dependent oxidoreductase [Amylostereum chailletii]
MRDKVVIVGAGCFGISAAYHLLKRGYPDVTVIDRSKVLPAPDAASTDLNKVVRTSYPDEFYTKLARAARESWKDTDRWGRAYHESGVLVTGSGNAPDVADSYQNDLAAGARLIETKDPRSIRSTFPPDVPIGALDGFFGFLNQDGGWVAAAQAVASMTVEVEELGGKIVTGKLVTQLVKKDSRVSGVRCADGTSIEAGLVILACGSWTASSFPELDLGERCFSTAQSLGFFQLTPEEGDRYRRCPVVIDEADSRFCFFPPTDHNVVKVQLHGAAYSRYVSGLPGASQPISTPRTVTSHGENGLRIPVDAAKLLRERLRMVYPELADKPFTSTRVCWYTDSPDSDWVVGRHPSYPGLALATAGSGHAFKFLPVIGSLVADAVEGKLDPQVADKFAVNREFARTGGSHGGAALQDIENVAFCTPEDLLP